MSRKRTIIQGTFILTAAGVISRILGFFYRIFMSRMFPSESIGLYQLIFPVYALGISLSVSGIQTVLSRTVAAKYAMGKQAEAKGAFLSSLTLCLLLSLAMTFGIQTWSVEISRSFLGNVRCSSLLTVLAWAFPFGAIHSIVCGYYFGQKKTLLPALSQMVEQVVRIGSIFLFVSLGFHLTLEEPISLAVTGLVLGEVAAAIFVLFSLTSQGHHTVPPVQAIREIPSIIRLSFPLTTNRVLLNILQSIEAVSIPLMLKRFGLSASDALSSYGVLTGMALPCVLFPSALTSSLATVLLPEVADLQTSGKTSTLKNLVHKIAFLCLMIGFACGTVFFTLGNWIGDYLFQNNEVGDFLTVLAFLCPFLYAGSTFGSILNGLGKTTLTLLLNGFALSIRIASVFLFIPHFGMIGYLWGLLISQLAYVCVGYFVLDRILRTTGRA